MIILLVVAVGLGLLALIHLVGGWVVSNGIYRGALAVEVERGPDLGVRVREVSVDRIVLEAPAPRQDIGHLGTLGLVWEGGYGRMGDVIDVDGSRFLREFEPVEGMPPVCRDDLETCPPVEIDPFVYPHDPGDVGLEFETTSYESPVGRMGAWLVPAPGASRWAIHCHGWTAEKREHLRMVPAFHTAGITSLVIGYRNDPGDPLDPTGRYRFGLSEWEDLEAAVGMALDRGANDVILSGCSTGGALIMAFLERSWLAESVSGVVLDSPNIILADAFRQGARDARATPLMIRMGMWIADLRWKIDWEATNFLARADRTLLVPTLVFHGTSDETIPISVSRHLKAKVPSLVELVETPTAGHVMSWNAAPARYERYLTDFLHRIQ